MLTLYQALEGFRGRQVVPMLRPLKMSISRELVQPEPIPNRYRWRYGVELACFFEGPEKAQGHHARLARELIGKEFYGELQEDLIDLLGILHSEEFRPEDNPAIMLIEDMRRKMRGEA